MSRGQTPGQVDALGDDLHRWRVLRNHSYRSLAELVPCDHGLLWKIEHGAASLTVKMARKCDELLGTGGALLSAVNAQREHGADSCLRPAQLPPAGAAFVGRQAELEVLDHGAFHGSSRTDAQPVVIAVDGPAGGGKTALALRWAHQVSRKYEDGQLYADLGGFGRPGDAVSVDDVMKQFLAALGSRCIPTRSDDLVAHYRSVMAGRRLLIVLDNVPDIGTIERLLPAAAGCCVVVTSRHDLRSLVAQVRATRVTAGPLSETDSLRMMRKIIGRRADHETAALTSVAETCGRLPLALRAVAEQIAIDAHRPVLDVVDEFRAGGTSWLDMSDSVDLRRSFSWSYERLSDQAAQALRVATLLGGESIHIEAIVAMTGATQARIRRLILSAAAVHLVTLGPDDMVRIQPLVRDYLREQADQTMGTRSRVRAIQCLVDWYAATMRSACQHLASRSRAPQNGSSVAGGAQPLTFVDSVAARAWIAVEAANLPLIATLALEYGPARCLPEIGQVLADLGLPHIIADYSQDELSDEDLHPEDVDAFNDDQQRQSLYAHMSAQPRQNVALTFVNESTRFGRRATDQLWMDVCHFVNGENSAIPRPRSRAACACVPTTGGCRAADAT